MATSVDKRTLWFSGNGPETDVVVGSHGSVARNLADLPFPPRCTNDEKGVAEERIIGVLGATGLLSSGRYCSMLSLDPRDAQLLAERHLVSNELVRGAGPRGVYIDNDQSLSIMVNERDHIRISAMAPGLQLEEIWARIGAADDRLASGLHYAFHERYGYLTSSLGHVGTGLKASVVLHLPGLVMTNQLASFEQQAREQRHMLESMFGDLRENAGEMYLLSNKATLGRSEEEIMFHLRQLATRIVAQERAARQGVLAVNRRTLEDRVARAVSLARGARLLEFDEAVRLLSSVRLGVSTGLLQGYSLQLVNELLVDSRRAHIESKVGHGCDDATVNMVRADMFNARFS